MQERGKLSDFFVLFTFLHLAIMELQNMDDLKGLTLDQIASKMHTMEELQSFLK